AAARRADKQDVRLGQLDVVVLLRVVETLVVIVDSNREDLLGVVLADDIVVENLADLVRGRHTILGLHQRGLVLLADDVHAQLNALIANEYGRPGNELAHLMLALAAEGAIESVLAVAAAGFRHRKSSLHSQLAGPEWLSSF